MISNMWSKDQKIRAKKSNDLYFKTERVQEITTGP